MGKIYILIGKSATGKDTIFKKLTENKQLNLKTIIPYTTRPMRKDERHGVEYYFVNEDVLIEFKNQNKLIEHRSYNTIYGVWHYFTANDSQIDLNKNNYLIIGTLEAYLQIRDYFSKENVIPIYIYVDDYTRLMRALEREHLQKEPKYKEMCRRFLADEEDFSDNNIQDAGIKIFYENDNIDSCISKIIIENFN